MIAIPQRLQESLTEAASAFRLGREGEASEALTALVDALVATLSQASPNDLALLTVLLPEILAAQDRQDFLQIADLLEYRLAPLLGLVVASTPTTYSGQYC